MKVLLLAVQIAAVVSIGYSVLIGSNKHLRIRRQTPDDRWSWGMQDGGNDGIETTQTPDDSPRVGNDSLTDPQAIEAERARICDRPDLVKPDFTTPGRSVSSVKCYEYIWQIKDREDKSKRQAECIAFIEKHRDPNSSGPFFAIGGRNALPGEFPHMGGVGWQAVEGTWLFKCGASLISERWTLTAAHCTNAGSRDTRIADPIPKIIRFGDKNIIDVYSNGILPLDRNISRIVVHPEYKSPKKYNDIALMEIDREISFYSNAQPACLWNSLDITSLGNLASVTGWGVVASGSQVTSPILQVAEVDFIDSTTCDQLLRPMCNRHWCGIQDTQICAGKLAGGVDACQGDSGGPLSVKINLPKSAEGSMHHLVGVTSFGFGCALKDTPGIYTRVSNFVPWIESIVWSSPSL